MFKIAQDLKEVWLKDMPYMKLLAFAHSTCKHISLQAIGYRMIRMMGASTVKWTTLDPCSSLSESAPKLFTNFEVYETKIHKNL